MSIENRKRPNPRQRGSQHEAHACRFLEKQGLVLVCRNYLCRLGEIDLIMLDCDQFLVFVEVRFRRQARFGGAIASVTYHKQRKLRLAASHFLITHRAFSHYACRFDVIGMSQTRPNDQVQFEWIQQAFT